MEPPVLMTDQLPQLDDEQDSLENQLNYEDMNPDSMFLSALRLLEGENLDHFPNQQQISENDTNNKAFVAKNNKDRDIRRGRLILQHLYDKCKHTLSTYLLGLLYIRGFGGRLDKNKGEKLCKNTSSDALPLFEMLLDSNTQKNFGRSQNASNTEDEQYENFFYNESYNDSLLFGFSLFALGRFQIFFVFFMF